MKGRRMFRPEATSVKIRSSLRPLVVEYPALGGQPALSLGLGDPDVAEDRGIDGSTSGGYAIKHLVSCHLLQSSIFVSGPHGNQLLEKTSRWRQAHGRVVCQWYEHDIFDWLFQLRLRKMTPTPGWL